MASSRLGRAYDDHLGRDWRKRKNERRRERNRWARETFGSDQRIAKARRRREREERRR